MLGHRGGWHRRRRRKHCSCPHCKELREIRASLSRPCPAEPATPREGDDMTMVLRAQAGELATAGQRIRGGWGKW